MQCWAKKKHTIVVVMGAFLNLLGNLCAGNVSIVERWCSFLARMSI